MSDFEGRMRDLQETETGGGNEQSDLTTTAFDNEAKELFSKFEDQLKFAQNELAILKGLPNPSKMSDEVEVGAVVMTDKINFLIAVSVENFDVEGKTFIGISTKAPIYKAMAEKKTGETFSFNGNDYKILDVI